MDDQELQSKVADLVEKEKIRDLIFSSPRKTTSLKKVQIRPLQLKGELHYQISEHEGQKVNHRNVKPEACLFYIVKLIPSFKQAVFFTDEADYHLLTNEKGKITFLKKKATKNAPNLTHNRIKNRAIDESAPFLQALGIKGDKFRQITRFLELVDDAHLNGKVHIVDFGCGKAYLTFALYFFLREVKNLDVSITGIDLKPEVISFCQKLAEDLKFTQLEFMLGSIENFTPSKKVTMVVSLHACNTATDLAIAQSIHFGAEVIMVAPCCQHELYNQIENESLQSLLQHGILKERFAALATDALRADLLEMHGYQTQVIEFIDSEHTPKNIMIRAIKNPNPERAKKASQRFQKLKSALHINPTLERVLYG